MIFLQSVLVVVMAAQALTVMRHSKSWKLESAVSVGFIAAVLLYDDAYDGLMSTIVKVFVALGIAPMAERLARNLGADRENLEHGTGAWFWAAAASSAGLAAVVACVRF
ncbi:hypothetical protein [Streptomyces sp. NPDC002845]